jgi:hypothetical protein
MPFIQQSQLAGLIIQGAQGQQGSVGAQGVQGATGAQGLAGAQGVQGATGAQGSQGAVGAPGAQGVQGTVGAQGTIGAQGVQGSTGPTGAPGAQGVQGTVGAQGSTGPTGTPGAQGVQGATGAQGVQGATGAQGVQGATGAQGTIGAQGVQGATGAQGTIGAQGVQGATGAQGAQGVTGPVAGSANQVVYKDGSNNAAGSANFTFGSTNSPNKLDIIGGLKTGTSTVYTDWYADALGTYFENTGTSDATRCIRIQSSNGSGSYAQLFVQGGSNYISFATSTTERMRIDSSGKVGIGTSSPIEKLGVNGSVRVTADNQGMYFNSTTDAILGNGTNHTMSFYTNNGERISITSAGNVGIGTSSPTEKLMVVGPIVVSGQLQSLRADSSTLDFTPTEKYTRIIATGPDSSTYASIIFATTTTSTYAERMRITSEGNVGIGTSSPATKLNIENAGACQLQMAYSSTIFGRVGRLSSGNYEFSSYENGGSLLFGTTTSNGSTTERMRINSSGNVGIGVTNPTHSLHVLQGLRMTAQGGDLYSIDGALSYYSSTNGVYLNGPGANGWLRLNAGGGENDVNSINIFGSANARIEFRTANTERMRITSDGSLLINGTTQPVNTYKQVITFSGGSGGVGGALLINDVDGGNYFPAVHFRKDGAQRGDINVSTGGTQYNSVSDYRLKENIAPMIGALAKVAQLKPVTYKWKENDLNGQGFIAHELAEVVPDCVTGEKDALDEDGNPKYQGVDTSFLVATLTAAIQEQQALIESLTTRLTALENR